MTFSLQKLPYAQNDLEPYISENTICTHYCKHHQGYIDKLNAAIEGTSLEKLTLEEIIRKTSDNESKSGIFNNAAQVWNHTFYWNSMKRKGGGSPKGKLAKMIDRDFGSYEKFTEEFKAKAKEWFGSGWVWLVLNEKKEKVEVIATSNAHTIIEMKHYKPLLVLDVWEHAYYLDYQNNRGAYIDAFLMNLVNWEFAEKGL